MRIISGKYKRTPLVSLEGSNTRPTKDMVKEALFDSLQLIEDKSFLDLFSGSGAIGIEALSRGASKVIFNDFNKKAVNVIESNLNKIHEKSIVLNLDYEQCLFKLKNYKFDYIFADPPYAFNEYENIFNKVNEYNLLNEEGIIIVEVNSNTILDDKYEKIEKYKEKKYGISKLIYFRKKED